MGTTKLWFRFLGLCFVGGLVAAACGGTGFSARDDSSDQGEGGAGTGGSAGTGAVAGTAGGTTLCRDATDCDDGKACTLDVCNDVGQCEHPPKCSGDTPACCSGVCGQCCTQADCDDGVDCTADDCFAGFCTHTPMPCDPPETRYCSSTGCRDREQCTTEADCDDGNACTTDTCDDGLCFYEECGTGMHCCADGSGCAACCSDSQCATPNDDVCNPSVCRNGTCTTEELCQGTNALCCERAGGTADCGVGCCTEADCPDIPCTRKLCTPSGCRNDPIAGDCPPGYRCEVGEGCVPTGGCSVDNPCPPPPPDSCLEVVCTNGMCSYQSACGQGTVCCEGVGCRECCSSAECRDAGRPYCCPDGRCGECCGPSDCGNVVAIITPPASPTTGGGISCTKYSCNATTHTCEPGATMFCREPAICCPGVGCVSPTQCSAI